MLKDMQLWVCVRVTLFKEQLSHRFINWLAVVLASSPVAAFADGDIAAMGTAVANGATSGMKSALLVAQFAGVIFVIGGLIAAKTKKDNPQVKTSHIIGSIAFGACLIAVPEMIKRAQTQVGLSPVTVG
ncbi:MULTISPECIES: DUF6750 family protein [unclassified Pseudomonas]|uniref:DUF6750 family protein n=1 Tax=unclassified Pseudomonas TaxID=196821 RepID=UPI002AB40F1B|nr:MULTISPECIES: DUF6750 family protein [unclassified Pseudomonas]MDY7563409.1 conjugal transfer protein TraR [Pseudomonas sp. AB6]MEA9979847.1 conjugal transfer protein TraR [Pseudomonas sp. RTS4]MEA9996479.1 conjugal transfer protein TraR [Pseudomonas sp. AA4]MEB0198149.1 conjugal transfer protein TraR [Pseudomonas sp. 5S4]MEB0213362.1 conjugal transfer protein TraR [Pseudomonas sp. AB6]